MTAALKLVDAQARPAPHPADIVAKGWRFELDYERIEQSDTWALANAEMKPWLLMLWLTAWKQRPCGTYPNDDALIAARIGMNLNAFRVNREVLMKGWWPADDGRLYHDTIAEQVIAMLNKKTAERERKRAFRGRQLEVASRNVPWDIAGTLSDGRGVPQEETLPEPTTGTFLEAEARAAAPPCSRSRTHSKPRPSCPHNDVVAAYHSILPNFPRVRVWEGARRAALQRVWLLDSKHQRIEFWESYFAYVGSSTFLRGDAPPRNPGDRPFQADLEWLTKVDNFTKVVEGKYEDPCDVASNTIAEPTS